MKFRLVSKFIQASHYTKVNEKRKIDLLGVHDMEFPERKDSAESVGNFFHSPSSPVASAHYCGDDNSIVQCVRDNDVAYAAPGANHNGLHFEFSGYAKQNRKQWLDKYGCKMLDLMAQLFARRAHKYSIPLNRIYARQVQRGGRGICGHADITKAFPELHGTHTDPGTNFPWTYFIRLVRHYHDRRYPFCRKSCNKKNRD